MNGMDLPGPWSSIRKGSKGSQALQAVPVTYFNFQARHVKPSCPPGGRRQESNHPSTHEYKSKAWFSHLSVLPLGTINTNQRFHLDKALLYLPSPNHYHNLHHNHQNTQSINHTYIMSSTDNTSTLQSYVDSAKGAAQNLYGSITGNTGDEVRLLRPDLTPTISSKVD